MVALLDGIFLSTLRSASFAFSIPQDHRHLGGKAEGTTEDKGTTSEAPEENQRREKEASEASRRLQKRETLLVKQAVQKQTRRLEFKIRTLRRRTEQVENRAREKIRIATEQAHREAERLATARLNSFKRVIRASVRTQLKKERERAAQRAETKYEGLKRSLGSALDRVQIKDRQVRELRDEIEELQKQLKRETTPQIEGFLYEEVLGKELRKRFPEDKIVHTGKGGDVIQYVLRNEEPVGILAYECKRVKQYSPAHVKQALEAKEKRKADFAILVTKTMKKGAQGFCVERGIMVVHPAGVLSLAGVLRTQVVRVAEMKLGQLQRNKAIKLTLDYLEGPEFANSMDAVIQESVALYKELMDEIERHKTVWKRRYSSYRKICEDASTVKSTTQALLSGEPEYKKLIRTDSLPTLLGLPELPESTSPREGVESTKPRERPVNNKGPQDDEEGKAGSSQKNAK